jgi:UDP-N-acetylglucosamine diphosphorylase/glucosamine-1-phosphate N-acetyltransferase
MHVVIFEGNNWRQFAPLTLSRPSFELCCGVGTLLEKQIRFTNPTRLSLWVRPGLVDYCRQFVVPRLPFPTDINTPLDDQPALLLSSLTVHRTPFEHTNSQSVVIDETPIGPVVRHAWVADPGLSPGDVFKRTPRWLKLLDLPRSMPRSRLPQYIWDLIAWNEESIVSDSIDPQRVSNPKPAGPYHMLEESSIWFGSGVNPGPGCVLDASKGPIILSDRVSIGANAVLQGPCCIGPDSIISPLSVIRPGVSIGPMCKIGGEVSNSIVLGYTNKPHEGFLGDSCIGQWVNLGSGTTTSNLRNTYSPIRMSLGGPEIDTGRRFLGSLIGDHTKIAIGTQLMTGSYIGCNCMIATSKYPPTFIPSFTFLTDKSAETYRLDKAVSVMKASFNRRNRQWSAIDDVMNQFTLETAKEVETAARNFR